MELDKADFDVNFRNSSATKWCQTYIKMPSPCVGSSVPTGPSGIIWDGFSIVVLKYEGESKILLNLDTLHFMGQDKRMHETSTSEYPKE